MARTHVWDGKTRLEVDERLALGRRINAARQKYQITQKALALKMGCTQTHVSQIERGVYSFRESYERALNAIAEIAVMRQESERMQQIASLRQQMAIGAIA